MRSIILKRLVFSFCILGLFFAFQLHGQQLRVSNMYIFDARIMNPAAVGTFELNHLNLSHQQRKVGVPGWRSLSQFVNFSSQPVGKKSNFAWGANIINDIEWTEYRLGISGSVSVSLLNSDAQKLNVGISGGLINWASNYEGVRVYDRSDELVDDRQNFAELDAGMGIFYGLSLSKIRLDLNMYGLQLPGNFISKPIQGIYLFPHLFVGGGLRFAPVYNLFIGPQFFYRDIFMRGDTSIGGSRTDIGIKAELDRQGIWGGLAYRVKKGALTLSFGLRIKDTDTVGNPQVYGYFVGLNTAFSVPMGDASVFGPTAEIGLSVLMGRKERLKYRQDTVRISPGPFWMSEGNLNDHMIKKLKPNGPGGLTGTTRNSSSAVTVSYQFDDNSYQYVGDSPQKEDSLLSELGAEWIGVDGFLENIVNNVVEEALNPDTNGVINPEVLEPLQGLISIQLSTRLLVDDNEAQKGAKGMLYEGELGVGPNNKDSLFIKVVYNDADTVLGIGRDRAITNLELAGLKLHAMRKKLEYELNKKYGEKWAVLWEGDKPTLERTAGKQVVYIKKPRIIPDNPHQNAFQVNEITMRFSKGERTQADVAETALTQKEKRKIRRKMRRLNATQRIRDRVY